MAPVVYRFSPGLNTFVLLETLRKDHDLLPQSSSSIYLFRLEFHQLYVGVGIVGMWNKL